MASGNKPTRCDCDYPSESSRIDEALERHAKHIEKLFDATGRLEVAVASLVAKTSVWSGFIAFLTAVGVALLRKM